MRFLSGRQALWTAQFNPERRYGRVAERHIHLLKGLESNV